MAKKEVIVISLGGSIIAPDNIDVSFLKKFKKLIQSEIKKGKRFILITGGGKTCRRYQEASKKTGNKDANSLDWIGIKSTGLNAEVVKGMFGEQAHPEVIIDPSKKINFKKDVLVGAGWKPGWSTDYDAVLLAKQFKATRLINLSNIEYVYDKDPRKYKNAKRYEDLSWNDFIGIVGTKWVPGKNAPFDPVATKLASKLKMEVVIMKGSNIRNIKKYLSGKTFKGTLIK